MTASDASDVEVAVAAAQAGAAVVASRYGTEPTRHAKAGQDFATDVDLAAERAIVGIIRAARPRDAVVGEEFGTSGDPSAARRWFVDPLCGTVNFAARTPLFSTNVALHIDGRAAAAAVADPLAGEVFWSAGPTTGVRRTGTDSPLTPSSVSGLLNINVDGPPDTWFLGPQLLGDPELRERFGLRVASTTLALAWVSAGQHAGYVTDGDVRDNVHFAAGLALCEAAGCTVTDLAGGDVRTGRGAIAAADPTAHGAVLRAVGRQMARRPASVSDGDRPNSRR